MKKWTCDICGYENDGSCQICKECSSKKNKKNWIEPIMYLSLGFLIFAGPPCIVFCIQFLVEGAYLLSLLCLIALLLGIGLFLGCLKYDKRRESEQEEKKRQWNLQKAEQKKIQQEIKSGIKKVEMVCDCGKCYPDGATFCAIDGKPLKRRVIDNYVLTCPTCKKIFQEGTRFCPKCGNELIKTPKI